VADAVTSFSASWRQETTDILQSVDAEPIKTCAAGLAAMRAFSGRVFVSGVGRFGR
jgi:hypothetical protein